MLCTGNRTVGSNPTLSASVSCQFPVAGRALRPDELAAGNCSYQALEVVQSRSCELRQAGNGATVAVCGCAAASPEPDQLIALSYRALVSLTARTSSRAFRIHLATRLATA